MAAHLPESVLPSLSASVFDRLSTLENTAAAAPMLRCLFAWNRAAQVLDLIAASLEAGASTSGGVSAVAAAAGAADKQKKRRRPKNASAANEVRTVTEKKKEKLSL